MGVKPAIRQPHATLDLPSRRAKAVKIERLLQLEQAGGTVRLLEVGTGSGGIANYFGMHSSGRYEVQAVDVVDSRCVREGYGYQTVPGTTLPFPDESFDVVLTNHVIEHVGDEGDQLRHLMELGRVMSTGGVGYLAVPNRWSLVEPHFRIAFLSWLPRGWRSPYLRLRGRGMEYDCEPLALPVLEAMFASARLRCEYMGTRALREVLAIERPGSVVARVLGLVPDWLLDRLAWLMPTLVYRFWK